MGERRAKATRKAKREEEKADDEEIGYEEAAQDPDFENLPTIDRVVWEPQPRQADALACPAFEVFFGGAKGGGKSDFLLGDYAAGIEEYGSAWKGIIFRRQYKELEEIIGRSKELYPAIGGRWVGGDKQTWCFPSGATLRFRALEKEGDVGKYNGHQYPWIGFDELTEFYNDAAYIFMIGCCRSAAGAPCYIRATGNPGRPGHVWVKTRFIDVSEPFQIYRDPLSSLTRCFIPSKLEDNLKLMQNDPMYEKRLLLQPTHLQKALRWGDWNVVYGQAFTEFTREAHIIPRQPLDATWYKFVSMDWGFAKPFSLQWWAVRADGHMIHYKEWYGLDTSSGKRNEGLRMGARAVAEKAWDMSMDEGVTVMVADPACWNKQDDAPSIAEQFEAVGWKMVKANNDRKNGLMRIHDMMQTKDERDRPLLQIMDNCRQWILTVPLLKPDDRDPEDIDTDMEDHAYDATRYAVMSEYARKPHLLAPRPVYETQSQESYDVLRHGLDGGAVRRYSGH